MANWGRYLPGANREETVQALENAGFKKTVDVTEVSVTLDGNAEQRYCLPDADLGDTVKALRRAGFEVVDQDVGDEPLAKLQFDVESEAHGL